MLKKHFFLLLLTLTTSFTYIENNSLLDESDYEFQEIENKSPAISIPLKSGLWIHFYNEWQCFPSSLVDINLIEVEYDGIKNIPRLSVNYNDKQYLHFELDHDEIWNTDSIFHKWNNELTTSQSLCIFGAFLESDQNEYFYQVEKIKFENSYWSRSEELEKISETEMED